MKGREGREGGRRTGGCINYIFLAATVIGWRMCQLWICPLSRNRLCEFAPLFCFSFKALGKASVNGLLFPVLGACLSKLLHRFRSKHQSLSSFLSFSFSFRLMSGLPALPMHYAPAVQGLHDALTAHRHMNARMLKHYVPDHFLRGSSSCLRPCASVCLVISFLFLSFSCPFRSEPSSSQLD